MKERVGGNQAEHEIFAKYFPDATIIDCALTQLPERVVEHFEKRSEMYILPGNYKPGNFSRLMVIDYTNGDKTYIAVQTKTYDTSGSTDELVHLLDFNKVGEEIGRGEIGKYIKDGNPKEEPYFKDKPFVYWSSTNDTFQRNGFGTRRLRTMNAISQMLYSLPLNSSGNPSKKQRRIWQKLVKLKEAERYQDKWYDRRPTRYRFVE